MRSRLKSGKLALLAILLLIVSACSQGPAYRYHVELPILTVAPIFHSCDLRDDATGAKEPTECVTLVRSDYRQIIVNLKAACLASGQSHEVCQAGEP